MKILCCFGKHQYGDPARGLSLEYAAFLPALARLGHEVRHFDSWDRRGHATLAGLNRALLDAVDDFRPDVLFSVHMEYELWLETLMAIRARGDVAMISWAADDSWKFAQVSRFVGTAYHAMATTYDYRVADYRRAGIGNVFVTQWAAASDTLRPPRPAGECRYRVSFVGAAHGARRAWIAELASRGIDVACFGHGWPAGSVDAGEIGKVMQDSGISLNFPNSRGRDQIKARTFEVPGAGGFLLTGHVDGLDRYYDPGYEIATFRDIAELAGKIHHYIEHPAERDAIAKAGHERTRNEHTYERRLAPLLDFAVAALRRAKPPLPAPPFDEFARRHRLNLPLKLLRAVLVGIGSTAFGRERGRRAARRLVFELSWRLAGRRAFTAGGWPGRMFPHE